MRLHSAPFAIDDERIRVEPERLDGIGAQFDDPTERARKGGRATHITPNLLATPHRVRVSAGMIR
jgi:hypothetical protein